MASPRPKRSLADLRVGERAVVRNVACERPTTVRLLEMGLVPGTEVEVTRRAPLGDPIELAIRGYSLSIRRNEATKVALDEAASPEGSGG